MASKMPKKRREYRKKIKTEVEDSPYSRPPNQYPFANVKVEMPNAYNQMGQINDFQHPNMHGGEMMPYMSNMRRLGENITGVYNPYPVELHQPQYMMQQPLQHTLPNLHRLEQPIQNISANTHFNNVQSIEMDQSNSIEDIKSAFPELNIKDSEIQQVVDLLVQERRRIQLDKIKDLFAEQHQHNMRPVPDISQNYNTIATEMQHRNAMTIRPQNYMKPIQMQSTFIPIQHANNQNMTSVESQHRFTAIERIRMNLAQTKMVLQHPNSMQQENINYNITQQKNPNFKDTVLPSCHVLTKHMQERLNDIQKVNAIKNISTVQENNKKAPPPYNSLPHTITSSGKNEQTQKQDNLYMSKFRSCSVGYETVKQIRLNVKKIIDPFRGRKIDDTDTNDNMDVVVRVEKITELFKKLRTIYVNCNRDFDEMGYMEIESLIPYTDNLERRHLEKNSAYEAACAERNRLRELLELRNTQLKEIIQKLRKTTFEMNAMIEMHILTDEEELEKNEAG